ncbi:SnoaL-like domain-containing protein [Roseivirga sp.]|uniref:SnoaL-like domain-containing protein n=1 Tax=Roseivirga sp. TaxID=1964215 RepID=UPI003B8AEE19
MTTQEIATKWAEYCRTGQMDKALLELYSQDCVSLEMEGAQGFPQRVEGMEAILEKGKIWESMVEEFHGLEIEGPIVAGNHFTATMKMDITMKGRPRGIDEEIALYRVENGKIVSEQFFYAL